MVNNSIIIIICEARPLQTVSNHNIMIIKTFLYLFLYTFQEYTYNASQLLINAFPLTIDANCSKLR